MPLAAVGRRPHRTRRPRSVSLFVLLSVLSRAPRGSASQLDGYDGPARSERDAWRRLEIRLDDHNFTLNFRADDDTDALAAEVRACARAWKRARAVCETSPLCARRSRSCNRPPNIRGVVGGCVVARTRCTVKAIACDARARRLSGWSLVTASASSPWVVSSSLSYRLSAVCERPRAHGRRRLRRRRRVHHRRGQRAHALRRRRRAAGAFRGRAARVRLPHAHPAASGEGGGKIVFRGLAARVVSF